MRVNLHKAGEGSAIDLVKELIAVASNPGELAKNLAQLDEKSKAASDAEKKLLERQAKVEALEAEILPKSKKLEEDQAKVSSALVAVEKEKADFRDKARLLAVSERDHFEAKEALKAEREEFARYCEGQKDMSAKVHAEAMKVKVEAAELFAKVQNAIKQIKSISEAL